jgi:4-hydroxyphenylpyruvate dioxygenase
MSDINVGRLPRLMTPRSIATVTMGGSLTGQLTAAAWAGFDGVEICSGDLDASGLTPVQVRIAAADLGLTIFLWQPLRDIEAAPPGQFTRNLERARRAAGLAADLGAGTIVVCSSVAPEAIDDDALAAAQLTQLAETAARDGVRVAYEALSWGTRVRTSLHAWQLVALAGHPNLGICLDSFHFLAAGEDPAWIGGIPGDRITAVQLADAPLRPGLGFLDWSRHHRCLPGDGDLDVAAFTAAVRGTGYAGAWALEIFNDTFRQYPPQQVADAGMRSLDDLEPASRRDPGWYQPAGKRLP